MSVHDTVQARAARAYARRGWPVFPCVPGGKVPLLRDGFHGASCDADTVAQWWRVEPRANVGLVPGRSAHAHDGAPGTLLVLDVDGPLGRATAAALGVPDDGPAAATGRPDGGEHRYFWLPREYRGAPLVVGNRALGPGLDVRHARGYVVAPPSRHPSGARYQWVRHGRPRPLPPAVLTRLLAPPAVASTVGADRPATAAPTAVQPISAQRRSVGLWPAGAAALRRAAAYVARMPHGLADGHGRNATAWRLAAVLTHGFVLDAVDVAAALAAWDAANVPPLGDAARARILDNARRYGARPVARAVTGARAA
ncbi:hypothetical protein tb265_26160 [Gemmatimonadetes bacterium T265]|nr:hypothetical protein tb265_26160 [Gemmatimonadetes bacterium T265]